MLVLLVNYVNYFQKDSSTTIKKIHFTKARILKEHKLFEYYAKEQRVSDVNSSYQYKKLMYDGKLLNYSQAMGAFQKRISKALKNTCTSKNIQWSHTSKTDRWYERLAINAKFECRPSHFMTFIKTLRDDNQIVNIETFKAYRDRRRAIVIFNLTLVAYRLKEDDAK
jgi:hypothetical protein